MGTWESLFLMLETGPWVREHLKDRVLKLNVGFVLGGFESDSLEVTEAS